MKLVGLVALLLTSGLCSSPDLLTAAVEGGGSHAVRVGEAVQLVIKVTNTGAAIPHLGLVFRTPDRWYERHKMTDLGGCVIDNQSSALDCGDLAKGESKTYSFQGIATVPGSFHYELALRELVHPYTYVNNHPDGPDAQVWTKPFPLAE